MFVDWKLSELKQNKPVNVFSCFCCGGGSTMGYKLAGFNVYGGVEIDPRVADVYIKNHNPKFFFTESLVDFNKRKNSSLPDELFSLDILDGSPPCSTFSLAGSREEKWGKKVHFREGQKEQVLDELFFHFIDTVEKLQPKVVVAENVKGMLLGNAKAYCRAILKRFDAIGYRCQLFLLNSAYMNVPQARERVFFIARKKSLNWPDLEMEFRTAPINFSEVIDEHDVSENLCKSLRFLWDRRTNADISLESICKRVRGFNSFFNYQIVDRYKICPTLCATRCLILRDIPRFLNVKEQRKCSTFPSDYDTRDEKPSFLFGMSVPPRMMECIANELWQQWFDKLV